MIIGHVCVDEPERVCGCVDGGGVGGNTGFTPGLAACGRIWGVCAPDVGTPLCAAGWLIFITTHNDGAREWALAGKGTEKQKSGEQRKRKREGRRDENKSGERREGRDKGNSEAEKLCFLLIQCQSDRAVRDPNHIHKP